MVPAQPEGGTPSPGGVTKRGSGCRGRRQVCRTRVTRGGTERGRRSRSARRCHGRSNHLGRAQHPWVPGEGPGEATRAGWRWQGGGRGLCGFVVAFCGVLFPPPFTACSQPALPAEQAPVAASGSGTQLPSPITEQVASSPEAQGPPGWAGITPKTPKPPEPGRCCSPSPDESARETSARPSALVAAPKTGGSL